SRVRAKSGIKMPCDDASPELEGRRIGSGSRSNCHPSAPELCASALKASAKDCSMLLSKIAFVGTRLCPPVEGRNSLRPPFDESASQVGAMNCAPTSECSNLSRLLSIEKRYER